MTNLSGVLSKDLRREKREIMPSTMATYVYASSQGQRTHSARTNCSTWTEVNTCTVDKLEQLQNQFLRTLLATPTSTPIPSLCWETGTLTMENIILKSKVMLYHHLINLDRDTLAKQIASIQSELGYPGLITECEGLVDKLKLPDIRKTSLNKLQ